MRQIYKTSAKFLWIFATALLLCSALVITDTLCRDLHPSTIDHIYTPQSKSQTQLIPGNKDYLQANGQIVWLSPWIIPEYGNSGASASQETGTSAKSYTFYLESPATQMITASGSAYINASAELNGKKVTLNLSLTEAGKRLLTSQKQEIQVFCGNTWATFTFWLLPQGVEIPTDADEMSVDVNQICKRQTDGVYLQDGKAYLLLTSANRNTYILTFLDKSSAVQGLRYSLDGGETFIQLHDWNKIYLPLQKSEYTLLILDYSLCNISTQSDLEIRLERQNDDAHKQQTVRLDVINASAGESLPVGALVTPEQPWDLPLKWNGCDYTWKVYQLTKSTNGELSYEQVEMPKGFSVKTTTDGLKISVLNGENAPLAGSYKMLLQWTFDGVVCSETTVAFFINYPLM